MFRGDVRADDESVAKLSDVSLVYLNEEVAKRVVTPITQLFVDLSDLDYTQS